MSGAPYISSDDSALLRHVLEGRSGGSCLEIGAGNGGALVALASRFRVAAGTDVARPTMRDWSQGADLVLADRASCFREGAFDLVAFNPPYLPLERQGDLAVEGGLGLEVPLAFLEEAMRVVKHDGTVLFLLNDEAAPGPFEEACRRRGFAMRQVASKRLFFEVLRVYEATSARSGPPMSKGPELGGPLVT